MWERYKSHARPLTRIVHGLPTLWEQSIATIKFPITVDVIVWSPCSRFIAVSPKKVVEIWDATTFRLFTFLEFPLGNLSGTQQLAFSPDSCLLTWFGKIPGKFISWDIQTGVLVSAISPVQQGDTMNCLSITYSTCGTAFGASFRNPDTLALTIRTYDVLSGTHTHSCSMEGATIGKIWTHGECFQTGTIELKSITIWEAGFTSTNMPTEVGSLLLPDDFYSSEKAVFHPTPFRFALMTEKSLRVWDIQASKILLDSTDPIDNIYARMSFSPDGHFFVCGIIAETIGSEIYLWKESPAGYTLHRKFISSTRAFKPLVSPNGELVIGYGSSAIQLWHITNFATSISTVPPRASEKALILGFSPNKTSAAVTQMEEKVVTVLDLKSGIPQLIINVGMGVYGLRMGENTIVIVGEGKVITWNLPAGDCTPNLQVNINESVQTTTFNHPPISCSQRGPAISVSPNLCHIAIVEIKKGEIDSSHLHLYDVTTGQCLGSVPISSGNTPWFTLDGGEVWCVTIYNTADRWKIVKGGGSTINQLEHVGSITHPPDGFPWNPSDGYEVMYDRWVFNPSRKLLLWFPPNWQLFGCYRVWAGQFLALLHNGLPEALILDLK